MTDRPEDSPLWPADNAAATAHINLIQGIITRLANNSASCKTWCLTLVGAFLALAGTIQRPEMVSAALITVLMLGYMDIMYLAQEIAYRRLHDGVVAAMRDKTYALGQVFQAGAPLRCCDVLKAARSWSVFPFYGILVLLYAVGYFGGWLAKV